MARQIFVNLPVRDLDRSVEFYTRLGFKFNPQFTDEKATCMIIGEESFVMLLVENFFQGFTKKPVADAHKSTEVLICISAESKAEVEDMVKKAVEAGGKTPNPSADHGWMYQHGFEDLDGHVWEIAYMDMSKFPQTS
jgi:predicted lactoylglutathione lyase